MRIFLAGLLFPILVAAQTSKIFCNPEIHRIIDRDFKNYGVVDGFHEVSPARSDLNIADSLTYNSAVATKNNLLRENPALRNYIQDLPQKSLAESLVKRTENCLATAERNSPGNYYKEKRDWSIKECEESFSSEIRKMQTTNDLIKRYQDKWTAIHKQVELIEEQKKKFAPSTLLHVSDLHYDKAIRYTFKANSPRLHISGSALELADKHPQREVHATLLYLRGQPVGYEILEAPVAPMSPARLVLLNENCQVISEKNSGLMRALPYRESRIPDKLWAPKRKNQPLIEPRMEKYEATK